METTTNKPKIDLNEKKKQTSLQKTLDDFGDNIVYKKLETSIKTNNSKKAHNYKNDPEIEM